MAEKDPDDARATEASLELPSFGLRRKRRQRHEDLSRGGRGEPAEARPAPPAARDEAAAPVDAPTQPVEAREPVEAPRPVEPVEAPVAHTPPPAPAPQPRVASPVAPAPPAPLPAAPLSPAPIPVASTTHTGPVGPHGHDDYDDGAPGRRPAHAAAPRSRSLPALPALSHGAAALVTGLVVGLVGVLLTLASMAACAGLRGTSTCGGPGVFLLLAILVVMFLLGRALLDAWRVPDAASTTVLAVGLVTVVCLTVLIDVILSPTMVVVVPLVALAAFGVSHWVTTKVAEAGDDLA